MVGGVSVIVIVADSGRKTGMNGSRFDGLTSLLASSSSRRSMPPLLLAALFGTTHGLAPHAGSARKRRSRRKRPTASPAGADRASCANRCRRCSSLELKSGAQLSGCDFSDRILTRRDLSGCDLRGACLQGADLRGVLLDGSDLGGACLHDALLGGASLRGVTLKQATLCGANLSNADLSGARVDRAQLDCALICGTTLPDGSIGDDDRGTSRDCPPCDDTCLKDEVCCDNRCVKTDTSTKHCARCGNACPAATRNATVSCGEAPDLHGRLVHDCLYYCDAGWEDCDNDFETGCEVFTRGDNANCGGCGAVCGDGMVCCSCACVPVGSGRCGVCPSITSARLIRRR